MALVSNKGSGESSPMSSLHQYVNIQEYEGVCDKTFIMTCALSENSYPQV